MMKKTENIIVRNWIAYWSAKQHPYIKDSTYATYMNIISNHILPYFGDMNLQDISYNKNQEFIWHLSQNGRLDNTGGLSTKTIKDILSLWLSILGDAEKEINIDIPSGKYKFPISDQEEKVKLLNIHQEHQMVSFLKNNLNIKNLGILLALSTGIRIGELCALQWGAISMESGTISISKTLQRIYLKDGNNGTSKVIITTPKSKKSIRIIPISRKMIKLLKTFQNSNETYFLTGVENKYIEPRVYREYYNRLMNKHNMHYVSFHGLRHTFATRCIEAGCDYKTLSEILGHADVGTTMRLYVHSDIEKKRDYIEKMQSLSYL